MIRSSFERAIGFTSSGNAVFFDPAEFSWTRRLAAQWLSIRTELDQLLLNRAAIPNFQDISEDQRALTEGDDWKTFFLYAYGHRIDANCRRCPVTDELLRTIPGMKTAMFSILAPRKRIPEHRGPYKGVLRYHLALAVPEDAANCRIRVGSEIRTWAEGEALIFDDSHLHQVWNDTDEERVVLFVDFARPLPFPLSLLNRLIIRRIAGTDFVTEAVERAKRGTQAGSRERQEGS